jgi:hypothetical protein
MCPTVMCEFDAAWHATEDEQDRSRHKPVGAGCTALPAGTGPEMRGCNGMALVY